MIKKVSLGFWVLVAALCVAGCLDERKQKDDLGTLRTKLSSTDYEVRKTAITQLLQTGKSRPLQKEEIRLLLPLFKSDTDWRIKVRITQVLPYANDKTLVLQPLLEALQERDEETSGGGNLQNYSCRALATLGDATALPAMKEWLKYLESNPKSFALLREALIEQANKCIAELNAEGEGVSPANKQ